MQIDFGGNMILMIYQKDTFREYVLPKTNNQDYSIILDKRQFHISDNITLTLELVDGTWTIHETEQYSMVIDDKTKESIELCDGNIIFFETDRNEKFQGIVAEENESFMAFEKYDIASVNRITFGKEEGNDVRYTFRDLVSKSHGAIYREGGNFYVEDYSRNGIFINYARITGRTRLDFGDILNIFGLHIIFLNEMIGISSRYGEVSVNEKVLKPHVFQVKDDMCDDERREKEKFYNRSPRIIPDIHQGTIEIEAPPSPKVTHKKPLLLTIGPSFTMAIPMMLGCLLSIYASRSAGRSMGAYMYTGIITSVGSAVIGVIWALANLKYSKQQEKEDEVLRFDSYGNYLIEIAEKLKRQYSDNTAALCSMYPSAGDCILYGRENSNLWNRNMTHDDFFFFRLGLGDIPFQVNIVAPKERFTMLHDSLKKQPERLLEEYHTLKNVPVGININEHKLWGIVGGQNMKGAVSIMHNLAVQIAANVCYTDVKMVFIYDENKYGDKEEWRFAKWLPHVWSEDKKNRYVASNDMEAKDVFFELSNIMRHRTEEPESRKSKIKKPYYVIFLAAPEYLEGELLKKYIYDDDNSYGLTTFIMVENYAELPNGCENIIQNDKNMTCVYNTMSTTGERNVIQYDSVDTDALNSMSRRLSNIRVNEMETNTDIPNSLEFLEMYGVRRLDELNVLDRWKKNRTFNTMKALIGKKAGGNDCYLDVHEKYHGPHGLIAGTTGSGKSETLQTYILSLAINFSPDDVGFFIIDFKGGGMANLFSNLPHMVGQISNLSGNQVRRAMISIKSENMRRQRIFSEYGVNNINLYTRLYKNNETKYPIPHLFIIIDEFAELKREEPEFMRELISVAQVGRSLGVHLILATQKPSGTVDDNIWSNSKFRLCLRVQDRNDSNDMLHKPDAAYITQAGRCYMQVGNDEIYELFQSGWSGALYDESDANALSELATMITLSGKTALVGSYAKIKRKETEKKEFYTAIVSIAISSRIKNKIFSLENLDDNILTTWAKDVIQQMNMQGIKYDDSFASVSRMKDMLKMWPGENLEPEKIAEYMMYMSDHFNVKLPDMPEITQLDAIVEYLEKVAKDNNYTHNLQLWLPVLPKTLYFESLTGESKEYFDGNRWADKDREFELSVPVGMYDDPENQTQAPVYIDFTENGHMAVCGTIVSGKSTFMQTLVYGMVMKYTPEYINMYCLDFSSGLLRVFDNMPQVGGVLGENDTDNIGKLFVMLEKIMNDRKKVFGGGNYAQYVKAYGVKYPAIFLVIDNYSGFAEKTENEYSDVILKFAREGVAYGIFLALSSAGFGMSEIPNRVGDNIKNVISLEMGDKFKYMDVLRSSHINVLPEADIKGRGLANIKGSILEFQTALSLEAEDDYKRGQIIEKLADDMCKAWNGKCARRIPVIPEKPTMGEFEKNVDVMEFNNGKDIIPFAYLEKDASVFGINLKRTYCYLVAGKKGTGKTVLMKDIILETRHKNGEMIIIEKGERDFVHIAEENNIRYLTTDAQIFDYFKELTPVFAKRNKMKHKYLEEELQSEELYKKMQVNKPVFIFIPNLSEFIRSIYKPEAGVGKMSGFMENIIEKGEMHNIYFIASLSMEESAAVSVYKTYKLFTGYKNGVHLGGNTASQRIFDFRNIPYTEAGKPLKKGYGWAVTGEDMDEASRIVIPMYTKGESG